MVSEKIQILVIDDDTMLAQMMVMALIERGYSARQINNPTEAVEAVEYHGAQIVLCDIRMPGIDGLEVTRRLKSRHGGAQVILMTGYPDQDTVDEAFHLGADDYLIKPFPSLNVVFAAIERCIERLRRWEDAMQNVIRQEFPEEYDILYNGDTHIPSADELESMISNFERPLPASNV